MAQDVAVAEPPMAVDRERRVIRNLVIEVEPAEPPICEVHLDLLAQSPLEADSIAVAHDQHPDHQLRINRRPTDLAVEGSQLLAQVSQHLRHHRIDPAQQMARRNAFFEVEQVKQLALIDRLPTHHGKPPPPVAPADGITVRRLSRALFQRYRHKADIPTQPPEVCFGAIARYSDSAAFKLLGEWRSLTSSDSNLLLAAALNRNCHGFSAPVTR